MARQAQDPKDEFIGFVEQEALELVGAANSGSPANERPRRHWQIPTGKSGHAGGVKGIGPFFDQ
jgi:hypothetical protein